MCAGGELTHGAKYVKEEIHASLTVAVKFVGYQLMAVDINSTKIS